MITREEFENVALLSKLYVPEDEYGFLCEELEKMMALADEVSEIKTEVEENTSLEYTPMREDEVTASLKREAVLSGAKLCADGCFKVEKKD